MWVLGAQVILEMSDKTELEQGMTECEVNSLCVCSATKAKGLLLVIVVVSCCFYTNFDSD